MRTGPAAGLCSPPARARRGALGLLIAAGLVLAAERASAMHRCGDDVAGKPVACGCGDLLVSSRTLGAADAVTKKPCTGNGLVVAASGPIRLDLGGRTIAGNGQGVGVLVVRGTLSLVGPGTIQRFETGVRAQGEAPLASVVAVRLADHRLDGLVAQGDGYSIQGSIAEGNGRDGFALGGNGYALDGNRASGNARYGFKLVGMGAHVGGGLGNEARANGMDGFWLLGGMHQVVRATAAGNGGDGLVGTVMHTLFAGVQADANGRSGLVASGSGLVVRDSTATGNRTFGIWVMGPGVEDGGGNRGAGNTGLMGASGHTSEMMSTMMAPLVQCRIGMMGECR
ncbi:MAG: right-handed parallel beta-helix repeat-containing protein [Deltaproteobacteria bacterium]|nr:MAG: right-handed parallel beta-helix repeat-containing protein [Deltaproteobacteria bacterium]